MSESSSLLLSCSIIKEKNNKLIFICFCLIGLFITSLYYFCTENSNPAASRFQFFNSYICNSFNENSSNLNSTNLDFSSIGDMSPKQIHLHNHNISYKGYLDKDFSKDCGIPGEHEQLFNLMKFWINFTSTYDIPWWLSYGSLIGSIRHKDMVAWDSDIDLGMPAQYESLLRNLSTPRLKISNKQVNIITRPGPHCPYNGPRMNCQGKHVTSQEDGCSFCGPLARIFYNPWKRMDIYLFDIQMYKNKLKIIEEGTFEYSSEPPRSPIDWYFPLRNCSFMGLTVQCPRKTEVVLTDYYTTYQSLYKCEKGSWIKI